MAIEYNKTNWVNNETKLNADNMNHIEDGIEAVTNAVNNIKLDNYLPLTGGTISGGITVDSNNNNGVYIGNSGIMFSPGPFGAIYLTKESFQSLSQHAYIHQYKLIKGSNVLIIQDGSSSDRPVDNLLGIYITDGQIGYFYNGTTTEPVLVKMLYDSGAPTGIQCLNFAEQVVTTFEYDQTTVTDIII